MCSRTSCGDSPKTRPSSIFTPRLRSAADGVCRATKVESTQGAYGWSWVPEAEEDQKISHQQRLISSASDQKLWIYNTLIREGRGDRRIPDLIISLACDQRNPITTAVPFLSFLRSFLWHSQMWERAHSVGHHHCHQHFMPNLDVMYLSQ